MAVLSFFLVILFICCSQVAQGQDLSKIQHLYPSSLHTSNDVDLSQIQETLKILSENFIEILMDQESSCSEQWVQLAETNHTETVAGQTIVEKAASMAYDAFGKPEAGILRGNTQFRGSFDECFSINVDIEMQYCLMGMLIQNTYNVSIMPAFTEAICLPSNCTFEDVKSTVNKINELLAIIKLKIFVNETLDGTVPFYYCTPEAKPSYSTGAIIMLLITSIFGTLVIVGTLFDLLLYYFNKYIENGLGSINTDILKMNKVNTLGERDNLLGRNRQPSVSERIKTFLKESLVGFSLYKTVPTIFSTRQPSSAITSINGIRVISMFWVILGHTYVFLFTFQGFKNLSLLAINFAPRFSAQAVLNGFFSVDSFFFLSGVLVSYLTFREMARKRGKFPFITYYLHRILRLTPTYMFVLFCFWFLTVHLGRGPLFLESTGPDSSIVKNCESYWWTNLLYINNFYPTKFTDQCMGWAWYLANDMQFFVISPLFLILLYTWYPAGLIAIAITLLSSFGVTGFIAGYYDYPANMLYDIFVGIKPDPNLPDVSTEIYGKPYCRIGPYLIGIVLGFILYNNYRLNIHKVVNWLLYIVMWLVAGVLGMAVVYGFYPTFHGHAFSQVENIMYFMFSRTTWGICLALVVYACHYGYGGVINRFLSLPFWVPLSRLTFNAYLVHEVVLVVIFGDLRDTIFYTDITIAVYIIANVVISYGIAGLVSIFVEFPLSNLESATFKLFGAHLRESTRRVNQETASNK